MSFLPDPDEVADADPGYQAGLVRFQAEMLYKRATWLEVSGMIGLAALFGSVAYIFSDLRGGWNHSPTWEPFAGLVFGAALGLGLARPFADWLRLQARMTHVQLQLEQHSRRTWQSSESTARKLDGLVDAGLSGEWRTASSMPGVPPVGDR